MAEVSSTRLYLGNLPRNVTKQDIEDHFASHGAGKITEVKLMNGFGFLEYEDAMDARDVVPAFHGSEMKGERLTVQFARGPRHKENFSGPPDRNSAPRPRRTIYRMQIAGLQPETSWQDLKDFARGAGVDVVYSETDRARDGKGFVEFESQNDLKAAIEKLDGKEYKAAVVVCTADIQEERPDFGSRGSYRNRSPPPPYTRNGGGYGPPRGEYPPRDRYRERSPGRRPPYDDYPPRDYGRRTPPPPARDPYGPPPPRGGRYDDYYDSRPPPPRAAAYPPEPYPAYGRPRSPPRYGGGYAGGGYGGGYDDRRYG